MHLFYYSSVALVHSTDSYGAGGASAMQLASSEAGMGLRVVVSFLENAIDIAQEVGQLRRSAARVIVLFSQAQDGSNFVRAGLEAGVGGEGYMWLSGNSDIASLVHWVGEPTVHQRAFRGSIAMDPSNGQGTAAHDAYLQRRQRLPHMVGEDGSCRLETDATGSTYIWAQDHDNNASTPLRCSGDSPEHETSYDAFGCDAAFAIAHALHDLVEVRNRTEVVGSELLEALIKRVAFEGVTGLVDFYDASAVPDRLYHGDRRVGFSYVLLNYVDNTQGLVKMGL
eukprot:3137433-Prymnesium_polylepis.1